MINNSTTLLASGNLRSILARHFKRGAFLRNLSIVMSGTAFAQMLGFAMMPIVSRLFSPSDFGIFGSYNAALSVFSAFVTLQYTQAIVLPEHKKEAINLFFVSCLSVALIASVCASIALVFPEQVQHLINVPNRWFLILLALAVLVVGLNQSLQAWCIRVKAFAHTSASQVIRSISAAAVWTTAGLGQMGAIGLVLGSIIAETLASLNLGRILKRDLTETRTFVNWSRMKQSALEYRDFPMFAAPQNLMNALSQGLPVLFLGHFYGIGVAGAYAFGLKILHAPMGLVLTPLRQVLLQKASEAHNRGEDLYPLFLKTTAGLMALALIPSAVLFIWAPPLFSWVFGSEWFEAGLYARWLILWIFIMFSNVPSVLFARILRQQRNLFLYECITLLSRTAVLVAGGLYFSVLTTIISFSVLGFVLNFVLILWIGILLFSRRRLMR